MIVRRGGTTGSQALQYDSENRLIRFSQGGAPLVEYGYAADGSRLWKRKNQTDLQVWIGNIYEEKGGKTLFHVFAGDQQICTFEPTSALNGGPNPSTTHVGYYYHQDHLNSSSALSGNTGSQIEANVWFPFGRTQTASPQAAFKVSDQFTGQVQDEETGLYYYNARYYDPELGRFIQADTIISDLGNPQSYNRYSYVLNNPLRYTDPTGHWEWPAWSYNWIPSRWANYWAGGASEPAAPPPSAAFGNLSMLRAELGGYDGSALRTAANAGKTAVALTPVGTYNAAYTTATGKDAYDPSVQVSRGERLQAGAQTAAAALPLAATIGSATSGLGAGRFVQVAESMSGRAASYQSRVTGLPSGTGYLLNGVKFDGFANGVLLDAKGLGYAEFVKGGKFESWWRGADRFVGQAQRQIQAAGGMPIQWHFAEEAAANATKNLFQRRGVSGIQVMFTP